MDKPHVLWAVTVLNDMGYRVLSSNPQVIQINPWSEVYRFETNQGLIILKKVPPALSLEPNVIQVLSNVFNAAVPQVFSHNQELHCFLMKDAGIQLHEHFKKNFKADVLIQAIQSYTQLQIMASSKIRLFFDLGVPDWRLEKLPQLYQGLLSEENLLIEDGLTIHELIELKEKAPKLSAFCDQLSRFKIKDTFGHADFHDKNILIDTSTNQTTIIDLGEVVITHPFFSFLNCIHRAKENFALSDEQYQQLQLACFKPWLALETHENLFEILGIIQQCWSIHSVLGEFRLMKSVDQSAFQALHRQGRLSKNLRYWINQD